MSKSIQEFSLESKLDSKMDSRLEFSSCKCSHCQRSFPLSALIHRVDVNGRDVYFCCNGCEGVYMLLHQSGFGGFYERLGSTRLDPATKQPTNASLAYLDEQTFLESHTKPIAPKAKKSNLAPELREVGLIIAVSYTHLTLPTTKRWCRSRWSPYH